MMAYRPITYTASQVARQIQARVHLDPAFGLGVLSIQQRRLMAIGRMTPTATVLAKLNLQQTTGGYTRRPR